MRVARAACFLCTSLNGCQPSSPGSGTSAFFAVFCSKLARVKITASLTTLFNGDEKSSTRKRKGSLREIENEDRFEERERESEKKMRKNKYLNFHHFVPSSQSPPLVQFSFQDVRTTLSAHCSLSTFFLLTAIASSL